MASEALHYLGVPTTRALSLVGTGAEVVRDMFYKCAPLQWSFMLCHLGLVRMDGALWQSMLSGSGFRQQARLHGYAHHCSVSLSLLFCCLPACHAGEIGMLPMCHLLSAWV